MIHDCNYFHRMVFVGAIANQSGRERCKMTYYVKKCTLHKEDPLVIEFAFDACCRLCVIMPVYYSRLGIYSQEMCISSDVGQVSYIVVITGLFFY